MKALPFLLTAVAVITVSCGQNNTNSNNTGGSTDTMSETVTTAATTPLAAGPQCFTQVVGKDTALLHLQAANDSIKGRLEYHRYEKDSNKGDFEGAIHDNIITAQYHFMSEGTLSTRPVVFKLDGERLYEGRPSLFDAQGVPVFEKDPARIQFDTIPFVKVQCP
ncbi:MAG TPA: hypothetical protein VFS25_09705 [Chitinophaga sp.]|uniref:hypothetical protein n=1 Tax=Chitinophaga sp. TaxID=1869181 RepID=UPI002DB5A9BA|nr:hypothetical protein [Chitinophaga sp.]HEU4553100.1 hypothetical protein [Chitinophaga sp.]